MSDKVCVSHAKTEWTDAVTIEGLCQMIAALVTLGHDENTLVTYMYDDDHVWLETVHDVEDEEDESRTLRVVSALGEYERDARWIDSDNDIWRWNSEEDVWESFVEDEWGTDDAPDTRFAPYSEIPQ